MIIVLIRGLTRTDIDNSVVPNIKKKIFKIKNLQMHKKELRNIKISVTT